MKKKNRKYTIMVWNSKRILIKVVEMPKTKHPVSITYNNLESIVHYQMKRKLRIPIDDPRWQIIPGELRLEHENVEFIEIKKKVYL